MHLCKYQVHPVEDIRRFGDDLDCRGVEMSANCDAIGSRWTTNYYITPATGSSDQLERSCWNENHVRAEAGPLGPRLSNPEERERKAVIARIVEGGQYVAVFVRSPTHLSHTTLSIKWEVYFSKELCPLIVIVLNVSACICVCIVGCDYTTHPMSVQSWWCQSVVRKYWCVHVRMSHLSSSWLVQRSPAGLVRLTWSDCVTGVCGRTAAELWDVASRICSRQNVAFLCNSRSPLDFFSMCFVSLHVVHPYSTAGRATAWIKPPLILSERSNLWSITC